MKKASVKRTNDNFQDGRRYGKECNLYFIATVPEEHSPIKADICIGVFSLNVNSGFKQMISLRNETKKNGLKSPLYAFSRTETKKQG